MGVCTGAFVLGMCGLLDGLTATTHRDFWDRFATSFPRVRLQRGGRFVDNGRVASSGALTSRIELALHVVERYFGGARATSDPVQDPPAVIAAVRPERFENLPTL